MLNKFLIALAAAGVVMLAGCQTAGTNQAAAPAISEDAKAALAKAEADVKAANAKNALWTTADDALKAAKEAAGKGDSAGVISNAKKASDHAKMGQDQKAYPLMTLSK